MVSCWQWNFKKCLHVGEIGSYGLGCLYCLMLERITRYLMEINDFKTS
ncbi:MAG: hypothetical protein ACTS78_03070 [Arsenophonus sp. NC-WZS1-MAG3]